MGNETTTHVLRLHIVPNNNSAGLPLRMAVALDTSGSMEGDKLAHARKACVEIAGLLREEDRLSLAGFSTQVRPLLEQLAGGQAARATAESRFAGVKAAGITRTDLAIEWIREFLVPEEGVIRVGMLITDGKPTTPKGRELDETAPIIELAGYLGDGGVTLYTVGLGDATNLNVGFLVDLSTRGHGAYLYAEQPEELAQRLRERFNISQTVAVGEAQLVLTPLLPGLQVTRCCRLRPEYLPLAIATDEKTVNIGLLRNDTPTDLLVDVTVPPLGFGERLTTHSALEIQLSALGLPSPIIARAELRYTASLLEAQQQDRDVDNDRILWEININAEVLARTGDLTKTGILLGQIHQAAAQVGQQDIVDQAAKQLEGLQKTGLLDAAEASRLLDLTRNRGKTE